MRIKEMLNLGKLATFVPNKRLPIYNWFYFKEGFSRDLVFMLIDEFRLNSEDIVLDPFCGSGTTMLGCKQKGINSIGFDVLPIAVFSSRVKVRDYDVKKLNETAKEIIKAKFKKRPVPKEFLKFFSIYTLEDVIFFKNKIMKIEEKSIREFFLLALINASMKCSYAFKDGGTIKIRKRDIPPLRDMLRRQIYNMIRDLKKFEAKPCNTYVDYCDARKLSLEDESIDAIITSPPYMNKIEYTRVYEIEHKLFLSEESRPSIRSFIGLEGVKSVKQASNIENASLYYKDMLSAIKEMYRICKKDARIGIVIGDGCFDNAIVEADVMLNQIARDVGFTPKETIILNKRICTTPNRRKIGIMKECLLIWRK